MLIFKELICSLDFLNTFSSMEKVLDVNKALKQYKLINKKDKDLKQLTKPKTI
ncbi:hypothetical protein GCM10022396_22770 [Flavivirga amylovorans]